jgi:lantibiotic biosynthesis protein
MAADTARADRDPGIAIGRFFALRVPLLPYDELLALGEGLEAPGADERELPAALAADRVRLRQRLAALIARPEIREALFVASPALAEGLPHWETAPDSERGIKAERTLVRYLARMASRPTPFGLFAGHALGRIGEATCLEVGPVTGHRRHTRLDGDYLQQLCDVLITDPAIKAELTYRPNSSLYQAGGSLRLHARQEGKQRTYTLVAIGVTDYLMATLERAAHGAPAESLAEALVASDAEVTLEEAREFIDELIASQVLVTDLSPAVTGDEPVHDLIRTLKPLAAAAPVTERLEATVAALDALDEAGLGQPDARYQAIAGGLEALPVKVDPSRLFQIDLVPGVSASLGAELAAEVVRAVELCRRITFPGDGGPMDRFREAFAGRYESAEVPLVEVLDEESGIGFQVSGSPTAEASPLLDGLPFAGAPGAERVPLHPRTRYLAGRVTDVVRRGELELVLDEKDLAALENKEPVRWGASLSSMVIVAASSAEAADRGELQVHLGGAGGPPSANLLGRFCHADPALHQELLAHLAEEAALYPGAVLAEIVHLPEGRVGNVLFRPVLRDYELPYLGRSGAPEDRQLPITDLMVSVRGGRVILRSLRLGKEIIPRLSNAHNFAQGLGLYRFLCSMQRESEYVGWSWGSLDALPFLPRVRHGRIVLSLARWTIDRARLEPLAKAKDAPAMFQAVRALRAALGLPRRVSLVDGDNILPVDLDDVLQVESLVQLVKKRPGIQLGEVWPDPDKLVARGPGGGFRHELAIPFLRTTPVREAAAERPPAAPPVRRRFPPGSEWLYVKLYGGAGASDTVLTSLMPIAMNHPGPWFFLRYGDPDWHVRFRLRGEAGALLAEAGPAIHQITAPLIDQGLLWRVQLDTYEREIERYGGPGGIELAERLFTADSRAILSIVELLAGDSGLDARWRLALLGIDSLLADLGFDMPARLAIMKDSREAFGREHRVDVGFERALGERFRRERKAIEELLDPAVSPDHDLYPGVELFRQRSVELRPIAEELRAADQAGRLTAPLAAIADSYVHMHCNRLLRSAQRAQELVLYDLLQRFYESQLARQRKGR